MHSSPKSGRRRLFPILAAGMLALSGCGIVPPEQAAETLTRPPPEPVPIPPPSSPRLPPRPFAMPLDGVEACELITSAQRAQLGFDRGPTPGTEPGFGEAATCSFRNSRAKVGTRLALVTIEGIDVWTSDTAQVYTEPIVIAGFPALVIRTPGLELACNVAVDVAEGQHLDVLYRDDGARPPPPLDQLCAGAERVAEAAVNTLKKQGFADREAPSRSNGEPTRSVPEETPRVRSTPHSHQD